MGLFELILKLTCAFSMISVCLHTPQTIAIIPSLQYILLIVDLLVTLFFTVEAFLKVKFFYIKFIQKEFFLKVNRKTINDRWCQFDLALLIFHYLSIFVHIYKILSVALPYLKIIYLDWYGVRNL